MDGAVDVAVVVFIEVGYGINDLAGVLGGCCVVKVDYGGAVDFSV